MTTDTPLLLKASHVSVTRGRKLIVDEASLSLRAGELTVLAGPNGAGKTTLARALAGVIPYEGLIAIEDHDLKTMQIRARARDVLSAARPSISLADECGSIVALGREPHADPFSQRSNADRAAIARAIHMTSLENLSARTITTLSGGERARVAIARALATHAMVLIADEPTASLDERNRLVVMELLRDVASEGGAVLAIIHDLALALRFADRVILANKGRIVADDTPAAALTPERIADIFGVAVNRVETPDGLALIPSRAL